MEVAVDFAINPRLHKLRRHHGGCGRIRAWLQGNLEGEVAFDLVQVAFDLVYLSEKAAQSRRLSFQKSQNINEIDISIMFRNAKINPNPTV